MPTSLKQKAYQTIRAKIVNCEYPPNSFLNEELLCKEINMSRTPIRDALGRLEQENMIKIIPKKGVIVAPLNINEINMIFETRFLIEPYVLTTYGNRINEEVYDQLNNILQEIDSIISGSKSSNLQNSIKIFDLDDQFHKIIVGLSKNSYIMQCYESINAQNSRLRIFSGNLNKKRLEKTQVEHSVILNEILKRNYKKASEAMEAHLYASKEDSFNLVLSSDFSL